MTGLLHRIRFSCVIIIPVKSEAILETISFLSRAVYITMYLVTYLLEVCRMYNSGPVCRKVEANFPTLLANDLIALSA